MTVRRAGMRRRRIRSRETCAECARAARRGLLISKDWEAAMKRTWNALSIALAIVLIALGIFIISLDWE